MFLAADVAHTVTSVAIPDGLAGTRATVRVMRDLARAGSADPAIRQAALNLITLQPARSGDAEVRAIFDWVRDCVRYVADPVYFERVAQPVKTLVMRIGDCDDKATLLAALLESVGYPTRFVVAGYNAPEPEHVYLQVLIGNAWVDSDATEPYPIGYAPPAPIYYWMESV